MHSVISIDDASQALYNLLMSSRTPSDAMQIYGLDSTESKSKVVYLPVPWDATTSYGKGAHLGPQAIRKASIQQDLYDREVERPDAPGLFMREISSEILEKNKKARKAAEKVMSEFHQGKTASKDLASVNDLSHSLNQWVYEQTRSLLSQDKIVGVVGGDHSVPLGAFQAAGEKYSEFGILHFDAHLDLRNAYMGFHSSHASIMHNALTHVSSLKKLVQVGIRDFCEEELDFARSQKDRVSIFFDADLSKRKFQGEPWKKISQEIISPLPEKVWISFDIDGLDPKLCPHTGTPVPGGLEFQEAVYLFRELVESGRQIIGFDLVEVAPGPDPNDEWDANVGMRMLYKLSAWALASQKLCAIRN